ncbi:hypothetical protein BKA65DRAFT_486675 [Rhexocercosporidium sp. MPI-PUGE-AT-0058]|nr:hypothetical protein BKA65DRAFT_486675 [Rhexocercosporidium sp. MPI-PUGE-AT-0058]
MDHSNTVNRTARIGNGEPATSSAVKGGSGKKKKKNKGKMSNQVRLIKNQKKKERKQRRKDGLDSSVMDSSVVDSSVMGDDTQAWGMEGEGEDGNGAAGIEAEQSFVSNAAVEAEESFVSPDLSRTLSNLFGAVPVTEAVVKDPKPKKPKKSNRASKKQLELEAVETNGFASLLPQEPEPMEEETQDMRALIRKEQLAKSKEKKATKSKKSNVPIELGSSGPNEQSQSDDLGLVEKIKKAKKKARLTPRKPSQESIDALQDEDDSAALLHQPLTPALFNHSRPQSPIRPTQEDIAEAEAQIQSSAWSTGQAGQDLEDDDEEEPKQPSKKALGKRKASSTAVESNAKRRKSKDKSEATAKLTEYGFVASSAPSLENSAGPLARHRSRSASHDTSELARTAASMYVSQMEEERTSPIPEILASSSLAVTSSQQRRPTPAFTPVNPRRPLAAVVIPPMNPFELPPSSQPHPESEPELPKKAPTSTDSRKRRLPTGEAESSETKVKAIKTPRKKSLVSKRLAKSMTPKSAAPKPKTPKLPAGSQATPASKGARIPEDDIKTIANAVESYREEYDLTQTDLNAIIQGQAGSENGRQFWTYIYEEVPHLPKAKVLNHCRRNFHNFEARGSWTAEADQDLKDAYERNPGKWKQIGGELNRFSEDCRDRWRNYLVCGDKLKKEVWAKEEEEKLKEVVEELLELIRIGEGKSSKDAKKHDYTNLDWMKVSEMMGHTRSRLQCLTKWKNIMEREDADTEDVVALQPISKTNWRLEEAENVARKMRAPEKLELLYLIRDSKAGNEGKIPWQIIQQDLRVKNRKMALRVCYRNLKEHIPDNEEMKLQDVVSALIDLYEVAAPAEPKGFNNFLSPARYNKSSKRKSSSRSVSRDEDEDEEDDENDNGEGPSTTRKRSVSSVKEDNGKGPSTKPPRLRLSKGRKAAMLSEMDHDNDRTPPKKSPKKLRSRMKVVGQKESQETTVDAAESADEISAAFQAVKSSQARSPRVAKKPIIAARTSRGSKNLSEKSKRLSDRRVVESEDEAAPASRSEHDDHFDEDAQPDEEVQQEDEDTPLDQEMREYDEDQHYLDLLRHEHEIPESDINMGNAPVINGHLDSEYEYEDEGYPPTNHDTASVDLDERHSITANGFPDDDDDSDERSVDEENVDYTRTRSESVESDTSRKSPPGQMTFGNGNANHDGYEDEDDESDVGLGIQSRYQRSGSISSDGVSSDASSIPHTPKVKGGMRDMEGSPEL